MPITIGGSTSGGAGTVVDNGLGPGSTGGASGGISGSSMFPAGTTHAIPTDFDAFLELRKPRFMVAIQGNDTEYIRELDNRFSDTTSPNGAGSITGFGYINPQAAPMIVSAIETMNTYGFDHMIAHDWAGQRGYSGGYTAQYYYTSACYRAANNTVKDLLNSIIAPAVTGGGLKFELYLGAIIPEGRDSRDWSVTGGPETGYTASWHYFGQNRFGVSGSTSANLTADVDWFIDSLSGTYSSMIWFDAVGGFDDTKKGQMDSLQITMGQYVSHIREYVPGGNDGDVYQFGCEGYPINVVGTGYTGYAGDTKYEIEEDRVNRAAFFITLDGKRTFDPEGLWEVDPYTTAYHVMVYATNTTGNSYYSFSTVPSEEELRNLYDAGFIISVDWRAPASILTIAQTLANEDIARQYNHFRTNTNSVDPGGAIFARNGRISRDLEFFKRERFLRIK